MYREKIQIKVLILTFCLSSVASQASCISASATTQCSPGKICRYSRCEDALRCASVLHCITGVSCVSDYCQPYPCTSTGQCVHGQICSQDEVRRCVYPIVYNIEEGSEVKLKFKEPATPGRYEEIQWYKESRSDWNRVAAIHPIFADNETQYWHELCSGNSPCRTSDRAHLKRDTGELTIFSVRFSDEGFYCYQFYIPNGIPDTGVKYEYTLNVYLTGDLTIEGLPDNYVEVGTNLTLTCTADRIRPEPLEMYWEINRRNETGTITTRVDDGDGVFSQTITYIHRVTKEDEDGRIKCVLVPRFGQTITVEKSLNPGYGPNGSSTIEATPTEQYNGEKVTLTCVNPLEEGNPDCDHYYWTQQRNSSNLPEQLQIYTQIYTFNMDEFHAGNYTCLCRNQFGNSSASNSVDIRNLGLRPTEAPRPSIKASAQAQYIGERVILTCENPPSRGNSYCELYTWRRLGGNINFTPETQIYTFIMDEFHTGNYTCQCSNEFGESEVSDVVEILYLGERLEHKDNSGLIAGCVIGVLVLAVLVIVGVIVFKRYKIKFNLKFQPRSERTKNVSTVDNGGYVDPVNNNVQPYEEVDNGENNLYQEVNNGGNNVNQYQDVNIGNQYDVINGGNIGNQYDVINGGNIGNQCDVNNEDAMEMPRGVGFVNPGMTKI